MSLLRSSQAGLQGCKTLRSSTDYSAEGSNPPWSRWIQAGDLFPAMTTPGFRIVYSTESLLSEAAR